MNRNDYVIYVDDMSHKSVVVLIEEKYDDGYYLVQTIDGKTYLAQEKELKSY